MEAPAARRLLKAANVETVELAGIRTLKILVMVNTRKKFPRGISDSVISNPAARTATGACTGSGPQAPSTKPQAPSVKLSNQPVQASSNKHQAPSCKHQASSLKLQAPRYVNHGTWILEKF